MRASFKALVLVAATTLATAPVILAADSVTKCGTVQLKAFSKLFQALTKEGARACAAGFANNPAPVNSATLSEALSKFTAAVQKAVAQFGQPNCFVGMGTMIPTLANVIDSAEGFADNLCSPATPTPMATP